MRLATTSPAHPDPQYSQVSHFEQPKRGARVEGGSGKPRFKAAEAKSERVGTHCNSATYKFVTWKTLGVLPSRMVGCRLRRVKAGWEYDNVIS